MLGIHLPIGFVEGLATGALCIFAWSTRPDIFKPAGVVNPSTSAEVSNKWTGKRLLVVGLLATLFVGGVLSWFASSCPDGLEKSLEWSLQRVEAAEPQIEPNTIQDGLAGIQENMAISPEYESPSLAGIVGGLFSLLIAGIIGFFLRPKENVLES